VISARWSFALIAPLLIAGAPSARRASNLHLKEVGSDSTSFDVVATLIAGPTESILWDAQYHLPDAKRLADAIAASHTHLKAIIISHPDHDHYSGVAAIVERFPGTPVYMTAKALAHYDTTAERNFQAERSRRPTLMADSLVHPRPLPTTHFTVDGEAVDIIPDLTGDVIVPTNSFLWIPSLRAALAGDIVFNGVHPWLGSSDEASRTAWRAAVQRIAEMKPLVVVAGHKRDVSAPDTPASLAFMDGYLADFDALRKTSADGAALRDAMLAKYSNLGVPMLLAYGAQGAYRK
jgi:glyoxylase-like metal-dependent hydrolase (beta-lactamase superfamily II)